MRSPLHPSHLGLAALLSCWLVAGAVQAAPAPAATYPVTCASQRVERDYEEGLRSYYSGKLDEAVRAFEAALKRDPQCAMAYWGVSRAKFDRKDLPGATAASAKAEELSGSASDREQRLISAWAKFLKSEGEQDMERRRTHAAARREVTDALTLYADDVDAWILRGFLSDTPLRATPYYLAALKIQPDHPFGKTWKLVVPPAPEMKPAASTPVAAYTGAPIPLFEGLGNCAYKVTTANPKAQEYFDQGMRCYDSYVTPMRVKNGAAQNFQYAVTLDPECAMAHWGLSFCYDIQGNGRDRTGGSRDALNAANRALELALKHGTEEERRICAARVLQLSGREKRGEFMDALDGAIAAYPEDVELWIWRGKALGDYGEGDPVTAEAILFELVAVRMHPEHPSPNHELVHAYEGIDRPALGWPYTEGYRKSAYNMPHANHMQAHLAMRLGRWQEAIDCTRTSRAKSLAGFPELDPSHHIDVMIRALEHEGRFKEADAEPKAYRAGLPWAHLLQLKVDTAALDEWAAKRREVGAVEGFYEGAIVRLDQGNLAGAQPFIKNLEERFKKNQQQEFYRYNEVQGRYLVQSGNVDDGLKLLREVAAKAVKDYGLHAWGGGSYLLEVWGDTALRAHRLDEAEEAYSEALAHEHGSVVGALGLQVVWEQRGRSDMAGHYAARAASIWKDADPGSLQRQLDRLRKLASNSVASN